MKHFPQRLFLYVIAFALLRTALQSAPKKKNSEPAIELSPFEVSAERIDFKQWIKVRSTHFVIYTDASQKEAFLVAKHLEMTRLAVQFYFHGDFKTEPPLIVLLPTSRSDWRKMESKEVEWKVASVTTSGSRPIVVLEDDWQQSPGLLWSMIGMHCCSIMNIEGPCWFDTGLIEFFDTLVFDGDSLTVGKEGVRQVPVLTFGWLSWDRFFAITRSSPEYYRESTENYKYFAQAAAFVHYLLTSSDPKSLSALLQWSAFSQGQNHWTEEDFKRTFGVTTTEMQDNIVRLLKGGRYMTAKIRFKPEALRLPMDSDTARQSEMRELFVLSQTLVRKGSDSNESLDALLANGLKNESLRELLADSCVKAGRTNDALNQYRLLIKNGSTNPEVFLDAAEVHLKAANAEHDIDARLGVDSEEAVSWTKRAVELDPINFRAYSALAYARAKKPNITADDVTDISRICHFLNGRASTDAALAALAVAYWRTENLKKAHQIDGILTASLYTHPGPRKTAEELEKRMALSASPAP